MNPFGVMILFFCKGHSGLPFRWRMEYLPRVSRSQHDSEEPHPLLHRKGSQREAKDEDCQSKNRKEFSPPVQGLGIDQWRRMTQTEEEHQDSPENPSEPSENAQRKKRCKKSKRNVSMFAPKHCVNNMAAIKLPDRKQVERGGKKSDPNSASHRCECPMRLVELRMEKTNQE